MSSGTVSGLLFLLFSSRTSKAGVEDWAEVTWGQMAGTEIANEKVAFGNSVKTPGNFILYLIPALGGAGRLAKKQSLCF